MYEHMALSTITREHCAFDSLLSIKRLEGSTYSQVCSQEYQGEVLSARYTARAEAVYTEQPKGFQRAVSLECFCPWIQGISECQEQ